ncbi:hypothetical protein [Ralstonia pseudosolanacearum]|nr:hypothetical protein [Ralstonia pseudosolanacearum]
MSSNWIGTMASASMLAAAMGGARDDGDADLIAEMQKQKLSA